MAVTHQTEHKSFERPDEARLPERPRRDPQRRRRRDRPARVRAGLALVKDVKPIAGTDSCEAPHFQYHVSGRLGIRMDDGTELVAEPGDITSLPSGHDAWVVGDEPAVVVDWYGASTYARPS